MKLSQSTPVGVVVRARSYTFCSSFTCRVSILSPDGLAKWSDSLWLMASSLSFENLAQMTQLLSSFLTFRIFPGPFLVCFGLCACPYSFLPSGLSLPHDHASTCTYNTYQRPWSIASLQIQLSSSHQPIYNAEWHRELAQWNFMKILENPSSLCALIYTWA